MVILILIGIGVCFAWKMKKNKYEIAEGSAVPGGMKYQENSVVMVEMSSGSEL